MGTLLAGGLARLILSLRIGTAGASILIITEDAASVASHSGEIRDAC